MKKALACSLLSTMLAATPAVAGVQVWNQFETEVPSPFEAGWGPHEFELETDVRYSGELVGLERVQLRWGPRWRLGELVDLGINHTAYLQQPQPGQFIQEQRLELQPTVEWSMGPLRLVDRNRLEYRWRPELVRWRYRNQLRVDAPLAGGWTPFVADEVFVDLGAMAINENRIGAGVAREVGGAGWEVSYTLRSGLPSGAPWFHDHLVVLGFFTRVERTPLIVHAPR